MQPGTKESLLFLIETSTKISFETTGVVTEESRQIAHIFFSKIVLTAITMWNIIDPPVTALPSLNQGPFKFYDASSAFTLVRNMFESYVNMHHLLIANRDKSELDLKLLLWNRHFRLERRRMAESRNHLNHQKLQKEAVEIESINNQIQQNSHFLALHPKQQKHLTQTNAWSLLNFTERAKVSGIGEQQVNYMYKLLSNYAHSESFAIMQYSSLQSTSETIDTMHALPVMYTEAFLSLSLNVFKQFYPVVDQMVGNSSYLKRRIELWKLHMARRHY